MTIRLYKSQFTVNINSKQHWHLAQFFYIMTVTTNIIKIILKNQQTLHKYNWLVYNTY